MRYRKLTRANILIIGALVLLVAPLGFEGFKLLGFEGASAGIAAEAVLVLLVLVWIGSYLFRVVTGNMTFSQQRKRYKEAYEELTKAELQARFDAMSIQEQENILNEVEGEPHPFTSSSDP